MEEARRQVKDVANDIRMLSHRLHSSKPEYLGVAAAAAAFCTKFSEAQKVKVDFHRENIPNELPTETSLCVYRILQEALQNASEYSGSRHFEVSLCGKPNEIQLTVRDWGIGFQPTEAPKRRAAGITIMGERLRLVDGELLIESQPRFGTSVHARVPLKKQTPQHLSDANPSRCLQAWAARAPLAVLSRGAPTVLANSGPQRQSSVRVSC